MSSVSKRPRPVSLHRKKAAILRIAEVSDQPLLMDIVDLVGCIFCHHDDADASIDATGTYRCRNGGCPPNVADPGLPFDTWPGMHGVRVRSNALYRGAKHIEEANDPHVLQQFGYSLIPTGKILRHLREDHYQNDRADQIATCSTVCFTATCGHAHERRPRWRCRICEACTNCAHTDARAELQTLQELCRQIAQTQPSTRIRTCEMLFHTADLVDMDPDTPAGRDRVADPGKAHADAKRAAMRRFHYWRRRIEAHGYGLSFFQITADTVHTKIGFYTTASFKELQAVVNIMRARGGAMEIKYGPSILAKDGFPPDLEHDAQSHVPTRAIFRWLTRQIGIVDPTAPPEFVATILASPWIANLHAREEFGDHGSRSAAAATEEGNPPAHDVDPDADPADIDPDADDPGEDKISDIRKALHDYFSRCPCCRDPMKIDKENIHGVDEMRAEGTPTGKTLVDSVWMTRKQARAIGQERYPAAWTDPPT